MEKDFSGLPMPKLVFKMCLKGALIAGSRANNVFDSFNILNGRDGIFKGLNPDSDWDLLVTYECWGDVKLLIPENATINSFGGFKFKTLNSDGKTLVEVDVWCDNPITYLSNGYDVVMVLLDYRNRRFFTSSFF